MLERLKYMNDKKILSILNDKHVIQSRTKAEIKKLIEFYKESSNKEEIYDLIIDFNLLNNRRNDEQINLMKKYIISTSLIIDRTNNNFRNRINLYLGKENYEKYINKKKKEILKIITDHKILTNREEDEQIQLIYEYLKVEDLFLYGVETCYVDDLSFDIITNANILNNFSFEEQLTFLRSYSKNIDDVFLNKMRDILNNHSIFETRTFSQIKELIEIFLKTDDKNIYKLILNEDILKNRTYSEQLKLIENKEELKNENYFELYLNKDMLENRTYNEQANLIDFYLNKKSNDVYELIMCHNLLINRTYNEQMTLIDRYLNAVSKEPIFNMLLDENVGKALSYQEQLKMIDNYFRTYDKEIIKYNDTKKELELLKEKVKETNILESEKTKCKK